MEEFIKLAFNYGTGFFIVILFAIDWLSNKKSINDTLVALRENSEITNKCLLSLKESNDNMAKSLELTRQIVQNQDKKIDKLLERGK